MTIHVFIGSGPANLHRAIKIKNLDPDAQIILIDNRLRPETLDIDRDEARANIFRFENEDVTQKLIADGVNLDGLIHERDFSVVQGFQHGDDKVFSNKRFSQIQIRDLQLAFLKTLFSKGKKPVLINQNVDVTNDASIQKGVAELIKGLNTENQDIQIHVATGALRDDKKKQQIIYPEKTQLLMPEATEDVKGMTEVPCHGTTTFVITGKVTCDDLRDNQRSLDLTSWQSALKEFGWNLVRPPRIRVFYANDILYIGAEIPAKMMDEKNAPIKEYEEQITQYTRKIASLVFPNLPINELPVNPHLRSRFRTPRGEKGTVITTISSDVQNITIFHHGDSRYLPHYQTGSGFVTGFLQNELYAEVYGRTSFKELLELAYKKDPRGVYKGIHASTLEATYMKLTGNDKNAALDAFRKELFMAFSRDIIEENKAKVGRYLNALHSQELEAFKQPDLFEEIIDLYNKHVHLKLKAEQFKGIDQRVAVVQLLKTNNVGFLNAILPRLLNKDFSNIPEKQLLHIRNMHVLDYENNLKKEDDIAPHISRIDKILKGAALVNSVKQHNFKDIVLKNMKNLADEDSGELKSKLTALIKSIESNKNLHCRAFFSFFKGKHSDTINKFIEDMKLITKNDDLELMRVDALRTIMAFNNKLITGNSQRTLHALQQVTSDVFKSNILMSYVKS
ncbi:hypothetical protein DGG96_14175 [Legionella qingyii]|uniref:Uncharacterized protein n=1 Tax=Legionella qingyii TaxID=2184757 RepID=A0A317U2H6_9GAMM|nr:hypothetical protein [Legionella qingyii]PWY54946.1 hypothetical protein DGG96_14175 [Legionella qingyii]RUR20985.1 hypothetical protein ELY20_13640 [Legionella qingyii]RUR27924.1 hypothetical protein ELY16_03875 [Legionella qingyii]